MSSSSKSNNSSTNCRTDMPTRSGRYALAATILASTMLVSPSCAFLSATTSSHHHSGLEAPASSRSYRHTTSQPAQDEVRGSSGGLLSLLSAKATIPETRWRPNPVVVSAEAEALSHSETTMKLTPSYELFQMLTEEEGGEIPVTMSGNALRDQTLLKEGGKPDTLEGFKLQDYNKLGGTKRIEDLPDPFKIVEKELQPFSDSIKELVSSDQPILSMAAKHFFEKRHGKRFRPTIVQLVAKAVAAARPEQFFSGVESAAHGKNGATDATSVSTPSTNPSHGGTEPLVNPDTTYGKAGGVAGWQWSGASTIEIEGGIVNAENHKGSEVWRRQAQLGQIVEMIHVASLIHDDVLDEADTRRGGEAVHKLYSNKVAVLAGDYLLARASVLLARLENTAVVQIMATALESLVAGEIMQLKSPPESLLEMESYLRKSYYKTASLICYACRSTALLGGHAYGSNVATACEEFGFHLGLAYQIQDDILDFTAAATVLGKPALADMDLGLSTAPILYAAQEMPHLKPLVMRRFKNKGDKQIALEALYKSETAMDKAKSLALFHAQVRIYFDGLHHVVSSFGF